MKQISCKCGHWYNKNVKCPECDTMADKRYNDENKIREEKIHKRYSQIRRIKLEIKDLEKELHEVMGNE